MAFVPHTTVRCALRNRNCGYWRGRVSDDNANGNACHPQQKNY